MPRETHCYSRRQTDVAFTVAITVRRGTHCCSRRDRCCNYSSTHRAMRDTILLQERQMLQSRYQLKCTEWLPVAPRKKILFYMGRTISSSDSNVAITVTITFLRRTHCCSNQETPIIELQWQSLCQKGHSASQCSTNVAIQVAISVLERTQCCSKKYLFLNASGEIDVAIPLTITLQRGMLQ